MAETQSIILEHVLSKLLKKKQFSQVLSVLNDQENEEVIKNDSLNLISAMSSILRENEELIECTSDVELCKEILLVLERKGNPKEVLLGLLDAADCFKEKNYFCALLTPIQEVLQRIPGKRGKSLEWVLSTLNAHTRSLPLPKDYGFINDELLLLDLDPDALMIGEVLSDYLDFLHPFVSEVSSDIDRSEAVVYFDRIVYQRKIVQKYLLFLLCEPLVYFDLHIRPGKAKSTVQACCDSLFQYLTLTCSNIFNLFDFDHDLNTNKDATVSDSDAVYDVVPGLAFGNLAYLIFCENFAKDYRPYIYSHVYLFKKHIKLVIALLSDAHSVVIYKGLHLCQAFLSGINELDLNYENLIQNDAIRLSASLLNVTVFCNVKEYRHLAVKIFTNYFYKFDWKNRYIQLMSLVTSISHSGVQGLTISLYKNCLAYAFSMKDAADNFIGKKLKLFLKHALFLEEGVETDILENSDKILSSLNLLRYILLRDNKSVNFSGIWDLTKSIENDFLLPLHSGIEMSKTHYQLEIKDIEDNKQLKAKKLINKTLTINEKLPNLPPNCRLNMLETAQTSLEMIQSILCRVKEILLIQ